MKTELFHIIDYQELENIFQEEFLIPDFEFLAQAQIGYDDHWNNDSYHILRCENAHIYTNDEVAKLMKGEKVWHNGWHDGTLDRFDVESILSTLRHRGELPNDEMLYLLRISW